MKVLLTEGLGDFLVLDAYLTKQERESVREILWASRARYAIQPLVQYVFPNLVKQTVVWDKWEGDDTDCLRTNKNALFAFASSDHIIELNRLRSLGIDTNLLNGSTDWSIYRIFPQIRAGKRGLDESSFLKQPVADVSQYSLPPEYVLVNPYSPNDKQSGKRDFTRDEWSTLLTWLDTTKRVAVVVNCSNGFIPQHKRIIDLSNKTKILEAIEIAKQCKYYIGIDSWIPALVSKFLSFEAIAIKTVSDHYIKWLDVYCAPHVYFNFVHRNLQKIWLE